MAYASPAQPMGEMNTTPLIDVMLVLLIMFIITLPVATHSVDIDLPQPGPDREVVLEPNKNLVVVTADDRILWNSEPLDDAQLLHALNQVGTMTPEPETQIAPSAAASYDRTAKLMRLVSVSGATKVGFVGNEQFRNFDRDRTSPPS